MTSQQLELWTTTTVQSSNNVYQREAFKQLLVSIYINRKSYLVKHNLFKTQIRSKMQFNVEYPLFERKVLKTFGL